MVAAFGLVFLIACANVANMMLARGVGRQREIAVRLSLGAARARVVRQLLIESLLYAGPAALVGYAMTYATGRAVPALLVRTWPEGLPPIQGLLAPMEPDARVVGFLIVTALFSAICFGLSPALQTTNTILTRAARGEFGEQVRASRVRNALVVAQIAAARCSWSPRRCFSASSLACPTRCAVSRSTISRIFGSIGDTVRRLSSDCRPIRASSIAAAWRPPFYGSSRTVQVRPEGSASEAVPGVGRSVLGDALRLGARGMVIGGALALALSQVLASLIEIMPPFSVTPYAVGALIVLLATATAALVPSLRASRVDPAVALRNE